MKIMLAITKMNKELLQLLAEENIRFLKSLNIKQIQEANNISDQIDAIAVKSGLPENVAMAGVAAWLNIRGLLLEAKVKTESKNN